jgi:hypothetical protein
MRPYPFLSTVVGMDESETCPGSGQLAGQESTKLTVEHGAWVAPCPVCGHLLELGYAGVVPPHKPALDAGSERDLTGRNGSDAPRP